MKPHPNRPSRRIAALLLLALALALSACGSSDKSAAVQPTTQPSAAAPTDQAPAAAPTADQSAAIASAVAATVTAASQAAAAAPAAGGEAPAAAAAPTAVKAGGQNDGGSGADAGDTLETALEIKSNTDAPYTGGFGDGDPADYYKLNIPAGSVVTIEFQNTSKDPYAALHPVFYRGDSNIGGVSGFGIGGGSKWDPTWLLNNSEGGNYVLGIESGPPYKFKILTKPQQDAGIEGDAGDTAETALVVTPNASAPYQGQLGNNDSADFYKVTLPAGSVVTFEILNPSKDPYAQLHPVVYHNGVNIGDAGNFGASGGRTWSPTWVLNNNEGGDYILEVGGGLPYTFNIISTMQQDAGVEGDAGDSEATARDTAIGQTVTGQVGNLDNRDTYRLILSEPTKLNLKGRIPEQLGGEVTMSLWSDGANLGGIGFSVGAPATLSGNDPLPAGTYFLVITGKGDYQVEISAE